MNPTENFRFDDIAIENRNPLELWAGVECTLNRVGDTYFDQLYLSGHDTRIDDLNMFAELGVSRLRYPVLWERTAPEHPDELDWAWADERLTRLRELNVQPIVGLVHHGSGPRYTSLVDSRFPEQLAAYARRVAERFPWVDAYTPINEPLTTARFSGLYGHWYPHGRDERTFACALLTQLRATVLAMRAIREVNPRAQLVQTDDLGKTFSTPALRYQKEFENERRWITFDILCGRFDRTRPLWNYLRWCGASEAELDWFIQNPCPPDILGFNYYLTSERFLDTRAHLYPPPVRGGNHKHIYADAEAVRVRVEGIAGPAALLREAWQRYRLPIAVTEAHNGCTREEQMRWFMEVWNAARSLREEGVEVRAVTAWSLLGAFNWNNLLTSPTGLYEPGVFDLRSPHPRRTRIADLLKDLAHNRTPSSPVLDAPGWWRRPLRLCYGFAASDSASARLCAEGEDQMSDASRPVVITGATGTLGRAFARLCHLRGIKHHLLTRECMDIADHGSVARALDDTKPWAVINTAGFVRVDDAERERAACRRENTDGAIVLANACAERDIRFLTFSSDLVFDGAKRAPYVESDLTAPLNVYGASKAEAERRVSEILPSALVVRSSAFFGAWDEHNFAVAVLRTLARNERFVTADDATTSPTYVPDLVQTCLDLLIDGEMGIWHLASASAGITWAAFARQIAQHAGLDSRLVEGQPTLRFGFAAARPLYSVLGSERGKNMLPPLEHALVRFMHDCEVRWRKEEQQAHEVAMSASV